MEIITKLNTSYYSVLKLYVYDFPSIHFKFLKFFVNSVLKVNVRDHSFKTSACLRGGGVYPCADGPKVTVHKDKKSLS